MGEEPFTQECVSSRIKQESGGDGKGESLTKVHYSQKKLLNSFGNKNPRCPR
jgi:hypothetical protein